MPVSVSIEPLTPSIDMYDSPDTSSAYSLSGHITITLTPSTSILGLSRPSPQNLLLTSLELTFEGQSELVLTDIGYAPLRIISLTKELVSPAQPVHISADDDRAEWRVVFNLAVPGWLPATAVFGDDDEQDPAGVSYALYARARFLSASPDLDDAASAAAAGSSAPSVWNNLCSVVRLGPGRPRAVHAEQVPICVTRYVSPPRHAYDADDASPPAFSRAVYAVQALPDTAPDTAPSTNIPADILQSVQLHAIVPKRTSVEDDSVPLALRLRSLSEDADTRSRLRVLGFEADIVQVERFHTSPSSSYAARYPIPPAAEQPPAKPLKSVHPVGTLFELGLVGAPPHTGHVVRERSIVPEGASKLFRVRGAEATEDGVSFEEGWLRMEVGVPVSPGVEERGEEGKRVAGASPFFDVRHEMRVRLTVGYVPPGEDGDAPLLSDDLAFVVPLEFVLVTPRPASPLASPFFPVLANLHAHSTSSLPLPHPPMSAAARPPSRARSLSALAPSRPTSPSPPPLPTPPPLPAYSQLFHENGDRKDDFHSALPLYREKEDVPPVPVSVPGTHSPSASTSSAASSPTPSPSSATSAESSPPPLDLASPPESPISPGMPLTPPGLGPGKAQTWTSKPKRAGRHMFGESFLRFDEDESEFEPGDPEVVGPEEGEGEDVQYGIAF